MKVVYKYQVPEDDYFELDLPLYSKPLSIHNQAENVYLWCLVDSDEKITEKRKFRLAGTGHPIEDKKLEFIGTVLLYHETLVFHLFEVK